ncbi:MAG TPA: hypothetical protein VFL76_06625 [Edaphocola sp.]|nr:hypothetical protein [Edaphocola sp.]
MNRTTTLFLVLLLPAMLLYRVEAGAQSVTTLETGNYVCALAKDLQDNIYVTRYNASSDDYEVVKYTDGTGTPMVIYSGLNYDGADYPWGLVVAANGDVYIGASNVDNKVIKLAYDSTLNTYTSATYLSGKYYAALAMDTSGNLYTTEYNSNFGSYSVVKYPYGDTAGTALYNLTAFGPGYSYPTGLAVSPGKDIYVTECFNSQVGAYGHVYKLTAASNYATAATISSGRYSTALALDPEGNLYCSEYDVADSAYVLNEYPGGSGTPVALDTLFPDAGYFFPWGIVARSSGDIYYANGDDGIGGGGSLLHLVAAPDIQASGLTFSDITDSSATLHWVNGNGAKHVVFMAQASTGNPSPEDSTSYTADTQYGNGAQIGASGWYCVYNGYDTSTNVIGLTSGTTYRIMVLDYNGVPGSEEYNTTSGSNIDNVMTSVPLPLILTDLHAELKQGVVVLSWQTLIEVQNKDFTVEWSTNGKIWKAIGNVLSKAADGNSMSPLSYSFRFDHPTSGINFFRLLQHDLDGRARCSQTVQVNVPFPSIADYLIFPNPVTDGCIISFTKEPISGKLVLRNAAGAILKFVPITGRQVQVNMSELPSGMYYFFLPGGEKMIPVVKK